MNGVSLPVELTEDGTILAECRLVVNVRDAASVPSGTYSIGGLGVTGGGLAAFRTPVESSEAFLALRDGRLERVEILAYFA